MKKWALTLLLLAAAPALWAAQPSAVTGYCYNASRSAWLPIAAGSGFGGQANEPPAASVYGLSGSTYYPLQCDANGNLFVAGGTLATFLNNSPSQYVGQQFGLMYSFGMTTWNGDENGGILSPASTFAPTNLNVDAWLDEAVKVNAKYVTLTTKWYDGFDLWPTKMTVLGNPPYSIEASPWYAANGNIDIVRQFVTKARARNLGVGLYINFNDKQWQTQTGTTPATATAAYTAWIEGQLQELLTNYGPIDFIWVDGWSWTGNITYLPYATVLAYIHTLQPNCMLINNGHNHPATASQIEEYETGEVFPIYDMSGNYPWNASSRLSEIVDTIATNGKWFYDSTCGNISADTFVDRTVWAPYASYTYLQGVAVDQTGNLQSCQKTALETNTAALKAAIPLYHVYPTNLARGKTVTVSSAYSGSYPGYKITDGVHFPASAVMGAWVSADSGDQNPYAEIDLGSAVPINTVQIYNGPFASPGRQRDLTVTVYDASHTLIYTSSTLNPLNVLGGGNASYAIGPPIIVQSGIAVTGQYVRVTRTGIGGTSGNYTSFSLAEVDVF